METVNVSMEARSRSNVYFLIARLWSHEVDIDLLTKLTSQDVKSFYRQTGGWLPERGIDAKLVNELAVEYCQCFLGPSGHLPPYQSVVTTSRFQSDHVESIQQYAEIIGPLKTSQVKDQPMLDHAATLLAMMGQLQLTLQRSIDDQSDDTGLVQQVIVTFFNEHLRWIIDYCDVAVQRSQSPFYTGLFQITKNLLTGHDPFKSITFEASVNSIV